MAYTHEALSEAELGPGVWKVVGPNAPAPLRAMVAKGLAPLPPRDLVVALYHFWCINDPDHAEAAGKTILGLPRPVLNGAFGDPTLPSGALDFLGRKLIKAGEMLEKVVRHPNVDDETLAGVARVCPEQVCDTLAENQQRWLQFPKIVESLYQNPKCRMSVVHRMLELAVREGVDVRLPNMDEIKQAMAEEGAASADPERDVLFNKAASEFGAGYSREVACLQSAGVADELDLDAAHVETATEEDGELDLDAMLAGSDNFSLPMGGGDDQPPADDLGLPMDNGSDGGDFMAEEVEDRGRSGRLDAVTYAKLRPMEKMRVALMGDGFERALAIRDSNRVVALSAIKSPRVKENEVIAYSANRTLSHDIIRYIATRRDWIKLYAVKLNLVMNPKTPMSTSMTLIAHLHRTDIRKVAQSKNIPAALATAAKRRMAQRR